MVYGGLRGGTGLCVGVLVEAAHATIRSDEGLENSMKDMPVRRC